MRKEEAIEEFGEAVKSLRAPWPFAPLPVHPAEIRFVIGDGITWPGSGEKHRFITSNHCLYYVNLPDGSRVPVGHERWKSVVRKSKMFSGELDKATRFIQWLQRRLSEASARVLDLPWQKSAMDEIISRARALELCGEFVSPIEPPDLYFATLMWYVRYAAQVLIMNFARNGDRVRLWHGTVVVFQEGQWPELRLYYPRHHYPPTAWASVPLNVGSRAIIDTVSTHHYLWTPAGLLKAIMACEEIIGKYP